MQASYLLALDQGTTSSRAVLFDKKGKSIAKHQLEFTQYFLKDGWVEHDAEEIWLTTLNCMRSILIKTGIVAKQIAAVGISNQRETTIIWDRQTSEAIAPAIVWQDRRTTDFCQQLAKDKNINKMINDKTGLLLDPYFSATKIAWLLDNIPEARERAEKGELAFGTVDSYLLWRLTKGQSHATDATNASRTMLFNIHTQQWDHELLKLFNIPENILPEVKDSCAMFGECDASFMGNPVPVTGMAGDQHAATVGQACFRKGMIKSTYGTGCFIMLNTGDQAVVSSNRLLTTVAYRLKGKVTYGLEGSIFTAGAAIKWLRDELHLIRHASVTEALAENLKDNGGVYMVPAFTGLGAPYWDPKARAAILGLTRDSNIDHIVRAALEAVCYQTRDLMQAMNNDYQGELARLRVDGGMVANNWLLQFLSDMLQLPVQRPSCIETSALGAAYLAGLGVGLYQSLDEISELWGLDADFEPKMENALREKYYAGWQDAVARIQTK